MKELGNFKLAFEDLVDHPKNEEIYGAIVPDEETINSIKERGILQDLLVSKRPDGSYRLVAGHKRKYNGFAAGLDFFPCKIREYESDEEENIDFVHSNKYREKNEFQKNQEIAFLNKQYKSLAKKRSLANLQNVENSNTYGENDSTGENSPTGRTVDLIAEQTGMSKDEIKRRTAIHDNDYRDKFFAALVKNNVSEKAQRDLLDKWDKLRELQEKGDTSLNAAYVQLREWQEKLLPSKKDEKKKAPKPTPRDPQLEVCAEIDGLQFGIILHEGQRKVGVKNPDGKVDVFEWQEICENLTTKIEVPEGI